MRDLNDDFRDALAEQKRRDAVDELLRTSELWLMTTGLLSLFTLPLMTFGTGRILVLGTVVTCIQVVTLGLWFRGWWRAGVLLRREK